MFVVLQKKPEAVQSQPYTLNPTGSRVWFRVEGPQNLNLSNQNARSAKRFGTTYFIWDPMRTADGLLLDSRVQGFQGLNPQP